jgi:hypothetical protein
MPDLSIAVRARKSSALRRRHEHVKIDLRQIAKKIFAQALVRDEYRDNERNMQRIVGVFVQIRLEEILLETRQDYPHIEDAEQLMGKVAFRKTTFVSDPQLHTLSLLMKQKKKQESHYSTTAIAEHIIRSFNKSGKQYSVMATLDYGDILIVADSKESRKRSYTS